MKKNFDTVLMNLDKTPLKISPTSDTLVTVKSICTMVLLGSSQKDNPSGDEKAKRYKLALRIHDGGEQDLTKEDAVLLQKLIDEGCSAIVVGQMREFLTM